MSLPIILASSSPRRQQLLQLGGINFTVLRVASDESMLASESPTTYIQRMVAQKAIVTAARIGSDTLAEKTDRIIKFKQPPYNKCMVITADTIGVLSDGKQILLKPTSEKDAYAMWLKMSANTHWVWTAVQLSIINSSGNIETHCDLLEKTQVTFIKLTHEQMQAYWQTGEPVDKAGGYAIQGKGAAWVASICGSYTNVVGLPLAQTLMAIKSMQV